jgi:NAD(P)-dependent dehydrogenase (short-subunit alcohol dehydrogenase family)
LFFCDLRVVAASRGVCERIASELRANCAENHLVERGTTLRHGRLSLYTRRVARGEGNPLPSFRKGVFASTELASLWHTPSLDYSTVPLERHSLPLAPASPAILRPRGGGGVLRDTQGTVSIHAGLRYQNTGVSGAPGQGKSSYLVASVAEDLRREGCSVIVLDPRGEVSEAVVSVVPCERTCTLLDLADPSCGFQQREVDAAAVAMQRPSGSPLVTGTLLKGSPRVSFDEVIANGEVLVVKGAPGAMSLAHTSFLMQLLLVMLDAALARRGHGVAGQQCAPVALKVDQAPLVLSRSFVEATALKGSTGIELVACWQTDAQWIDRDVRRQLDALFAHRVYFATPSIEDARSAAKLMMAEFSDVVRPDIRNLSALGRPDVRLHLPRHSAVVSWVTPAGRQAPFIAHTLPLHVDIQRVAYHAARQANRRCPAQGMPASHP